MKMVFQIFTFFVFVSLPLLSYANMPSIGNTQASELLIEKAYKNSSSLHLLHDTALTITFTPQRVTQATGEDLPPIHIAGKWKLQVLAPDSTLAAESEEFAFDVAPISPQKLKIKKVYRGLYRIVYVFTSFSSEMPLSENHSFSIIQMGKGDIKLSSKKAFVPFDFSQTGAFFGTIQCGPYQRPVEFLADLPSSKVVSEKAHKKQAYLQRVPASTLVITFTPQKVMQATGFDLPPIAISGTWKMRVLGPDSSVVAESGIIQLNSPPDEEQRIKIWRVYRGFYTIEFVLLSLSSTQPLSENHRFSVIKPAQGTIKLNYKTGSYSLNFSNDGLFFGSSLGPNQYDVPFLAELP